MENRSLHLAPVFEAVGEALRQNRGLLNQSDPINGNHGDHMVTVFRTASACAAERPQADLAETMDYAAERLEKLVDNASARLYAGGLRQIAAQLRLNQVSLEDLVASIQAALQEESPQQTPEPVETALSPRRGNVIKSLLAGLAAWNRQEEGKPETASALDLSAMVEFGMAYLQAKNRVRARGGERAEILAEAAVSASPLGKTPYRYQSGVIAVLALLKALQACAL